MKNSIKKSIAGIAGLMLIAATLTALCSCGKQEAEQYNAYVCTDHHLESMKSGKYLGYGERSVGSTEYGFSYWEVDGDSDGQFVLSGRNNTFPAGLTNGGLTFCVLQNPENSTDVLHDWTVKEIQLCQNTQHRRSEDHEIVEEPAYTVLASSTDGVLIDSFRTLTSKETEESYENFDQTGYDLCKTVDLRILFEESENLVWISECRLYQSKKDPTSYAVTLDLGEGAEEFSNYGDLVAIDGELESFIRQTLLEAEES